MNAVLVFFVMLSSFIIDTTLVIRMLIYLFMLAFIEISLIFLLHGDVDPDTRSILNLREEH